MITEPPNPYDPADEKYRILDMATSTYSCLVSRYVAEAFIDMYPQYTNYVIVEIDGDDNDG